MIAKPFYPAEQLEAQILSIFQAWGFTPEHAASSAKVMVEADLNGIDSHGITMLLYYEGLVAGGALNPRPNISVLREKGATALLDGDRGLGHGVSIMAMDMACEKAAQMGVGVVAVRGSDHFGAAGYYAARAAARGMVSLITSNGFTRCVVPAGGAQPMFSTNPVAFGAPARSGPAFGFDIATSTSSIGKVNLAWLAGKPLPAGWVVDAQGRAVTDPAAARVIIYETGEGGLTPLGGTPDMSMHKGYGLCAMVEILSALIPGARPAPLQTSRLPDARGTDTGHFFMALDPEAFRDLESYHRDMDDFLAALRACRPSDPERPVLVPGEIEWRSRQRRLDSGVPLAPSLIEELKKICVKSGAAFVL